MYAVRRFLDSAREKRRDRIGFTGANSGCTEQENHQDFTANCSGTRLFLWRSLRTVHQVHKNRLFFFCRSSASFLRPLPIPYRRYLISPPRALAAATPTTPQCASSIPLRFISLADIRPMKGSSQNSAYMQA